MIHKITHGFVCQVFDDDGKLVSQTFTAGDDVAFEDAVGNPVDEGEQELYAPFDMVQFCPTPILSPDVLRFTALNQPDQKEIGVTVQVHGDSDIAATIEVPTVAIDHQQLYELGRLFIYIASQRTVDTDSGDELIHGFFG